jgi:F-type H+-transporting ATPase subunit delta
MLKGTVGSRYAEALYQIATRENIVDAVEAELKEIDAIIQGNPDLKKIIYHPQITAENKKDLFKELLEGKISQVTMDFLKLLVERQREQVFGDIVNYYVTMANKARNISEVKISSAVDLSQEEKQQLSELLSKLTGGKKTEPIYTTDPAIIGGVVVRIGDRVIDGSIRTRLATLREHLRQIS